MGYGAYMSVRNARSAAIHTTISSTECMYDNGDEGSRLSTFDNATIAASASLPSSGSQYIEAKASGGCAFDDSTFHLNITDATTQAVIGEADFVESSNTWYLNKNSSPQQLLVTVRQGNQATISVLVRPAPAAGPTVNRWVLSNQNRCADIWYNQDYTVYGLNPSAGQQGPSSANTVSVHDQGNGTLALQCAGGYNAYASVRDDWGYQVQFQAPGSADWCTTPSLNETLQAVPTGDGGFALYSPWFNRYIAINPSTNPKANGCNPLIASATSLAGAAHFTATGLDRSVALDFLQMGGNATGLPFGNTDLSGRDLSKDNLSQCDLTGVTSLNGCVLDGANLQQANLSGLRLAGARMAGTDCTSANLTGCDFTALAASSSPPVLTQANLTRTVVPGSLAGANLQGAVLTDANLTGADLTGADLSRAVLGGATLTRAVLKNADLSGAHLAGLDLSTATLTGANLTGADLTGATLGSLDLTGANLAGTNFTWVDLTRVTLPSPLTRSTDPNHPTVFANATLPYAAIKLNWSYLDLTSTTITGLPTDLTGLVATSARRPNGNFQNATLDKAVFDAATLDGASFSRSSLRSTSFAGARLTGAVFTHAVLDTAVFSAAALGGVTLNEAANFSFAFVSNCNFSQANLFGVIFAGATLVSGNTLQGGTSLQQADFAGAYLPNADFTGANLQGAKFDGAFMVECVLDQADLSPAEQGAIQASLTSACLQAASLSGANLSGANLTEAVITDTRGQINQQYYGEDGQLTEMIPMRYPAGVLPAATSFSSQTVCPNSSTYATNAAQGLTIEQMMTVSHPPTQWTPANAAEPGSNA